MHEVRVGLRQSQEPGKAATVTSFFGYTIRTVCQCLFAHCHLALQHASSGKAPQILSTCIHFTALTRTCVYLTSCNTTLQNSRIWYQGLSGPKASGTEWQRYVHALSGGTKPVYSHSSLSGSLCCLHLLAHPHGQRSCLGAGLSSPSNNSLDCSWMDGWMDGGGGRLPKGQVQVPLLYAVCSLAAHLPQASISLTEK